MKIALKIVLLSVLLFVCYAVSAMLSGISSDQAAPDATPARIGAILLVVCLIDTIVLSIPILLSRYRGIDLILLVFMVYFGVETFMSQIEAVIFQTGLKMSLDTIHGIVTAGLIRAALFAPLAVWILGRMRPSAEKPAASPRWALYDLTIRWILLAAFYVVVYFSFGYFVAWQSPDVRMLYSGSTDIKPFFEHTLATAQSVPWFFPIQFVRGLLWVGLGLMICRMINAGRFVKTLTVALIFGLVMTVPLLLPNPWMSDTVRMVHFVETCSSMLLFGAVVGFFGSPTPATLANPSTLTPSTAVTA